MMWERAEQTMTFKDSNNRQDKEPGFIVMRVAASAGDVMSRQSEGLDQSRCLSESKVTFKVMPKKKKINQRSD